MTNMPFKSLLDEANAIDERVQCYKERLAQFPEGTHVKTRARLANLISEGMKKSAEIRVIYSQNSQRY